jgi:hypothetical protein
LCFSCSCSRLSGLYAQIIRPRMKKDLGVLHPHAGASELRGLGCPRRSLRWGRFAQKPGASRSHRGAGSSQVGTARSHLGTPSSHLGNTRSHVGTSPSHLRNVRCHLGTGISPLGNCSSHLGNAGSRFLMGFARGAATCAFFPSGFWQTFAPSAIRAIYLGLATIFFWAGTLTSGRMRSRFLTQ